MPLEEDQEIDFSDLELTLPDIPGASEEQREAVRAANNFLVLNPHSKEGLYEMLIMDTDDLFEADDMMKVSGFSEEAARFAVDHIDVDWKEQAARAAKQYAKAGADEDAIRATLTAPGGLGGFTKEEADYAIDQL